MRTLVTGATGFLGSRVARQLVDHGEDVRVLARPTSDLTRVAGLDLTIVHGDVTDRASVVAAVTGVDVVFHCAAFVELGRDRAQMHHVNVDGTRNVLEVAVDHGATAVHVSSVAALGPTGSTPVDESWWAPQQPSVAYEATKREAHVMARAMAARGASVRIGVPGGIYGYGDRSSMAKLIGGLHLLSHARRLHARAGSIARQCRRLRDCASSDCRPS